MSPIAELTADELLHLNLPNKRTELVKGALMVREPAGFYHGTVAGALTVAIGSHVKSNNLGLVFAAETGFKLFSKPDTVRAPDVAFIRRERVPRDVTRGYAAMAPDLVVEVLSPDDPPGEVAEKVADWLEAGTALVWIIDPLRRRARIHRADGSVGDVPQHGALDGEGVLPGFRCALAEVL